MSEIHSFNCELAAEYGVYEAILIQHFIHWITANKRMNRNFHEGKTWTYMSLEEISAYFSYISRDQANRIIRKLCSKKVLIKGNFNNSRYDRTIWYSFVCEEKFLKYSIHRDMANPPNAFGDSDHEKVVYEDHRHLAKSPNGNGQIATPIPDTKTNIDMYTLPLERGAGKPAICVIGKKIPKKISTKNRESLEEVREGVYLSLNEIEKLKTEIGGSDLQDLLDEMEIYQGKEGKIYADHYKALRNWIRRNKKQTFHKARSRENFSDENWIPPSPRIIQV